MAEGQRIERYLQQAIDASDPAIECCLCAGVPRPNEMANRLANKIGCRLSVVAIGG